MKPTILIYITLGTPRFNPETLNLKSSRKIPVMRLARATHMNPAVASAASPVHFPKSRNHHSAHDYSSGDYSIIHQLSVSEWCVTSSDDVTCAHGIDGITGIQSVIVTHGAL